MIEKYLAYLQSKFQCKVLGDGTSLFCDSAGVIYVKIYASLDQSKIDNLDAQYALRSINYKRGERHFPGWYKNFLSKANGLNILFSSLTLDGLQTIDRKNYDLNSPYDLLTETNGFRPNNISNDFLGIGSYSYNHSDIFVNAIGEVFIYDGDGRNLLKQRGKGSLRKYLETDARLLITYPSFEQFLLEETKRLIKLYKKQPWDFFSRIPETVPNYVR